MDLSFSNPRWHEFADPAIAELADLAARLGARMEGEVTPAPDPIVVPEDLSALEPEALDTLRADLQGRADELAEIENMSDDECDELDAIADSVERIGTESDRRAHEATELAERRDRSLARIRGEAPQTEDGEATPGDGAAEPPAVAAEPEGAEPEAPEAIAAAAAAPPRPAGGARTNPRWVGAINKPGTLTAHRPPAAAPVEQPEHFMVGTTSAPAQLVGQHLDSALSVADAVCKVKNNWARGGRMAPGQIDYVSIATGTKTGFEHELSEQAESNFAVLRDIRAELGTDTWQQALVAAAGGQTPQHCAPLTPLYNFFRTAVPMTPYEDSLPVASAPRGGIQHIVPPSYTHAVSAIGHFDNSDPNAPDKPCLHVDCPDVASEYVTAITQCVEFDNLQYRIFPELVASFMEDVAVNFADAKETKFLDFLKSKSTAVTADTGLGISLSLINDLTSAAARYRRRAHMPRSVMLQLVMSDYTIDMWKVDMAMRGFGGTDWYEISDAQVTAFLRARGLDPVWVNNTPTTLKATYELRAAQAGSNAALLKWPCHAPWFLYAPGTFVRMDSGTLDLGMVRDSLLNKKNNLQLFMEEWNGMIMLGQESLYGLSTVAVNGDSAGTSTPITDNCT